MLSKEITRHRNHHMMKLGLNYNQSEVMRYILYCNGVQEVTSTDIMADLSMSQATVSDVLKKLEAMSLITRRADPADKRRTIIAPSPKGLELEMKLIGSALENESAILSDFDDSQKAEFQRLIAIAAGSVHSLRTLRRQTP